MGRDHQHAQPGVAEDRDPADPSVIVLTVVCQLTGVHGFYSCLSVHRRLFDAGRDVSDTQDIRQLARALAWNVSPFFIVATVS